MRTLYHYYVDSRPARRRNKAYFEVESSVVPLDLLPRFELICRALHLCMVALLRRSHIRGFSIRVILTNDIVATVRRVSPPSDEYPRVFNAERLGGTVFGKTIHPKTDGEPYTIIMRDETWAQEGDDALGLGIALIAHELGHCAIDSCRKASGYAPPVGDITTGESVAREIAATAVDEYRADRIENLLLGAMGNAGEGDEAVPIGLHHVHGHDHIDALGGVLSDEVYPGWPDRVQAFREWQIGMDDMWMGLGRSGWEVFVLIAHAAAVAWAADDPDPIISGELADHPAVSLYLGKPWECLLDIADSVSMLCTPAASAKMDARIYTEAVDALLAMWGELGLTFALMGDGGTHIGVTEPRRA